jgi:16S rRNA (guanine527-N7)-methyltransferase
MHRGWRKAQWTTDMPTLEGIARRLGLTLDSAALERLHAYLSLLQRWNTTYNLTAVRDPALMLTHHLADCLAIVPPLRRHVGEGATRLLDVGSGGGLPGAVISIVMPQVHVTCVDAVAKKAAFIRQIASELEQGNLAAEHGRVENGIGRFGVVVSRAFASLSDFCSLTTSRLSHDGVWLAMKGRVPKDELQALPKHIDVFHVEHTDVPYLDAQRCLVWMRRGSA